MNEGNPPTDRHARELVILYRISTALNSAPNVRDALERTLALVGELLGLDTGWVWLTDPETGQFYSAAVRNLPPYLQEPVRMTGKPCWCLQSFEAGDLAPNNVDVLECSRLRTAVLGHEEALAAGLRYHASIPLYFQDRPLGIINVAGPAWRRLTRAELRLLATIANQVAVAVERARLAEAAARLARAEERTRIAREIHDTLAQNLTAIGLQVDAALKQLETNPARARERLERALALSDEGLEEARRSVLDLRAPLGGRPLPEALEALGRRFTSETGIRVRVTAREVPPLPVRTEAELYRIAQEALTNVRKHAAAHSVQIALVARGRRLRLVIRDDGQGLDCADEQLTGFGVSGMRERARLLGGRLSILGRPGRGTTIAASIPLEAP